jgi:hypothetical protein
LVRRIWIVENHVVFAGEFLYERVAHLLRESGLSIVHVLANIKDIGQDSVDDSLAYLEDD